MERALGRITVSETVYHQLRGDRPISFSGQFARSLETTEQPYTRRTEVGETWSVLDTGWVEEPAMILLINEEGRHLQQNPTDLERAVIGTRCLRVRYEDDAGEWLVPPGESFRGRPNGRPLMIRCEKGTARYTLHAFPR